MTIEAAATPTLHQADRICRPLLIGQGLSAAVYTQTTDVEGEVNGLLTYDRSTIKINANRAAEAARRLYDLSPELTEADAIKKLWDESGATEAKPRPFLKYLFSRIVSIAFVSRLVVYDGPDRRIDAVFEPVAYDVAGTGATIAL